MFIPHLIFGLIPSMHASGVISRPETTVISEDIKFDVKKVIKTGANYYVVAESVLSGVLVFNENLEFVRLFGSNKVTVTSEVLLQQLQNLYMSDEQIAARRTFTASKINGIAVDKNGFVVVVSSDPNLTVSGSAIRCLNFKGSEIDLGRKDAEFGDKLIATYNANAFSDIAIDDDNFYAVFDSKYGRAFVYSEKGELITCFGGIGTELGLFTKPVAIETIDSDVIVLDSQYNSVTVFKMTDYGKIKRELISIIDSGDFEKIEKLSGRLLDYNTNCQYAQYAMGFVAEHNGDYKKAMQYYENANDRISYAQSFKLYRTQLLKENIIWVIIVIVAVISAIAVLVMFLSKGLKKVEGVAYTPLESKKSGFAIYSLFHPADAFWQIKTRKVLSPVWLIAVIALFVYTNVFGFFSNGFIHNLNRAQDFNIIIQFAKTVGLIAVFVISNWAICTIMDGKGKPKEILYTTAYALIAVIILSLILAVDCLCVSAVKNESNNVIMPQNRITEKTLLADNEDTSMFIDEFGHFELLNKSTGFIWSSYPADIAEDTHTIGISKRHLWSEIVVNYVYRDAYGKTSSYEENSVSGIDAVESNCVNVYKTENGAKVVYDFYSICASVALDYTVKGNRLSVKINGDEISEGNAFKKKVKKYATEEQLNLIQESYITSIWVLPSFGAGTENDSGFVFVPDGSGAYMNFKPVSYVAPNVSIPFFSEEFALDEYGVVKEEFSTVTRTAKAYFPMFSIVKNENGLMGVISENAENSELTLFKAGRANSYTGAAPQMIYRTVSHTVIGGREVQGISLVESDFEDFAVDYHLLNENLDYAGIAKHYRNILEDEKEIKKSSAKPGLALNAIGAIDVKTHFLGIPCKRLKSLTSYEQLGDIILDLKSKSLDNISVNYLGWNNNGIQNKKINNRFKPIGKLGGKKDFKNLLKLSKEKNYFLTLDTMLDFRDYPKESGVRFYNSSMYKGLPVGVACGSFGVSALSSGKIESFVIDNGYKVTAYAGENCTGKNVTFGRSVDDASVCDFDIASVKVECTSVYTVADVNFDGRISLVDLLKMKKSAAGIPVAKANELAADIDNNGSVNASDLVILKRMLLNIQTDL